METVKECVKEETPHAPRVIRRQSDDTRHACRYCQKSSAAVSLYTLYGGREMIDDCNSSTSSHFPHPPELSNGEYSKAAIIYPHALQTDDSTGISFYLKANSRILSPQLPMESWPRYLAGQQYKAM